ncbi:hypothetical protein [Pseudomonas syringae group sp. J309-1]|uniref:hypothetical protein n=1 Tax=Pseudomonas syringae group sp. J309-1 TaxID=3079588 RepID=UPI00290AEF2E|nr:hypothetical protein [Pseudomonas syringae group sp. J309-1]MDU8359276.1 hypothetical protein [Pseudomonas syringae group sp. J309-1]
MFNSVVELYRFAGCPPLSEDGAFSFSGPADDTTKALTLAVKDIPSHEGEMTYYRETSGTVRFEFTPNSSGENSFFPTFQAMVQKTSSLGRGEPLNSFYVVADNWASYEKLKHPQNDKIIKACKLIKDLSKVAVSEHLQTAFFSLVFSTPSGNNKPPKTLVIQTKLSEKILEIEINKTSLISGLASEENKVRIHLEERRAILNGAICEALDTVPLDHPNKFIALLESWDKVLEIYWQNFQIYIHSFSFEKVRKEFAQAELDYGAKLSAAFSDIAGKMLALPISLIAIITLSKAQSPIEIFVTTTGLTITSIVLIGLLINQLLNIQRLDSSLAISFENLTKSIKTYPKNLQLLINKTKKNIEKQKLVVSWTIRIFILLSLSPMLGAALFLLHEYAQWIHNWLLINFHAV